VLRPLPAAILLIALAFGSAPGARPPYSLDASAVLGRLKGASITSLAQDSSGNLFLTGTTASPSFPVKNAAQSLFAEGHILRTSDLGATWSKVDAPADVTSIVPDPVDQQVLFGLSDRGIYKSEDAGRTWRQVSASAVRWLAVDPADRRRVLAIGLADNARVLRSVDAGETWTQGAATQPGPIVADPSGSGAVIVGGSLSRDWGQSFALLDVRHTVSGVAFDPAHRGWIYLVTAAGSLGGLYLTTDFGATWTEKMAPSMFALRKLLIGPDGTIFAVGPDGPFRSTDGAASWTRFGVLIDDAVLGNGCREEGVVFAKGSGVGTYASVFSADWGATWKPTQFTGVQEVGGGASCTFYVTRQTSTDGFVAKLSPTNAIEWATYLGGSDADTPVRIVVDGTGSAYVAGSTTSPDFPGAAAPAGGAFLTKLSAEGRIEYTVVIGDGRTTTVDVALDSARNAYFAGRTPVGGFLAKISPAGVVLATAELASYPFGIVVDSADRPILASRDAEGTRMVRMNASLSAILDSAQVDFAETGALAIDSSGNLIFAGATYGSDRGSVNCRSFQPYVTPMTLVVTKLRASDWSAEYRATAPAPCGLQVHSVSVNSGGAPVVPMWAGLGFPTVRPVYGGPPCLWLSGAAARLSPDGSRIDFGSYFDTCAAPGVAPSGDGLIVGAGDRVMRVSATSSAPRIDAITNAFSGDPSAVVDGALFMLAISGFTPPSADLGFQRTDLPSSLSGVEVRFDGVPAGIVQTAPGRVVLALPRKAAKRGGDGPRTTGAIQLFYNGVPSNVVRMPVVSARPGILNYVANEDGSQNSSDHPARPGSTVTLFVTGIGGGVTSVYSTWQRFQPGQQPTPLTVQPLVGSLPAIWQVKLTAPGTPGHSAVGLRFTVPASSSALAESNYVDVYIQ
jgi:uncharacterized protein (TIGR03437 family)